jgi:hypothetical protein
MLDQLPSLVGFDLSELAGAHASGEIPVPAALINRVIAARLADSRSPIAALVVDPRQGDVVLVHVRLHATLVPPLTIQAVIDAQPRLPASPVLVVRWSLVGLGILGRLASPVLALFGVLPPGISVSGDRLAIDLAEILTARGHGDLLTLLTHLEVATADGGVVVRFEARVQEPRSGPRPTAGAD